jgi:hypothetical protein
VFTTLLLWLMVAFLWLAEQFLEGGPSPLIARIRAWVGW